MSNNFWAILHIYSDRIVKFLFFSKLGIQHLDGRRMAPVNELQFKTELNAFNIDDINTAISDGSASLR